MIGPAALPIPGLTDQPSATLKRTLSAQDFDDPEPSPEARAATDLFFLMANDPNHRGWQSFDELVKRNDDELRKLLL